MNLRDSRRPPDLDRVDPDRSGAPGRQGPFEVPGTAPDYAGPVAENRSSEHLARALDGVDADTDPALTQADEWADEWAEDDHHDEPEPEPTLRVLVYSDDRLARQQIRIALGRRPSADLPALEYVECATEPAVIARVDAGGLDLIILDGEATPAGGMGVCRQLKDEIYRCPPVLVVVGRPQDAWLATWSRADGVVSHPIDAVALARVASSLLQRRASVTSV